MRAGIATRWAAGWEYFDAVVFAMEQNALIMMDRANKTDDEHSAVREALLLIQSAATATTHEIRILLQAGLWAGAAGRWRALHELAVTGTLLSVCDASIAERYVDHSFVVNTKRLRDFYLAHGTGPASREVLDERWVRAQAMISQHHDARDSVGFTAQYAWATPLLPAGKSGRKPRPTFDALEALAKMADLRSLVGTAHGLVHNDGAGIIASVIEEDGYILTPSDRHIETVARPTLLSIRRMVGATHLGFEGELNEFAKMIGLLGATLMHNALLGARAFGLQETDDPSPASTP